MKYLLPCKCGHRTEVDGGQAGQRIVCACGAPLDVPTMRELRNLDPVELPTRRKAPWTRLQGVLFVVGMLVLSVCIGVGIYFLQLRRGLDTERPEVVADGFLEERAGLMSGEQLLNEMHDIEARGLGPRQIPEYVENRRKSARNLNSAYLCFAIGGGGLALALVSTLIRTGTGAGS
jgi:hypothetical protein